MLACGKKFGFAVGDEVSAETDIGAVVLCDGAGVGAHRVAEGGVGDKGVEAVGEGIGRGGGNERVQTRSLWLWWMISGTPAEASATTGTKPHARLSSSASG